MDDLYLAIRSNQLVKRQTIEKAFPNYTLNNGKLFGEKDAKVRMRLGRADTYNIIQNHEGEIEVNSEVGRGREFQIRLPLWAGCGNGYATAGRELSAPYPFYL